MGDALSPTATSGTVRVFGDRGQAEAFIPGAHGDRARHLITQVAAMMRPRPEPMTDTDRQAHSEAARHAEIVKAGELARLVERHDYLVSTVTQPALIQLLSDHAPHVHKGSGHADCWYCGGDGDTEVWSHLADTWVPTGWPCGVWQTISDHNP